jgi:hypothetical protein
MRLNSAVLNAVVLNGALVAAAGVSVTTGQGQFASGTSARNVSATVATAQVQQATLSSGVIGQVSTSQSQSSQIGAQRVVAGVWGSSQAQQTYYLSIGQIGSGQSQGASGAFSLSIVASAQTGQSQALSALTARQVQGLTQSGQSQSAAADFTITAYGSWGSSQTQSMNGFVGSNLPSSRGVIVPVVTNVARSSAILNTAYSLAVTNSVSVGDTDNSAEVA